jgi:hypothetical protein
VFAEGETMVLLLDGSDLAIGPDSPCVPLHHAFDRIVREHGVKLLVYCDPGTHIVLKEPEVEIE